MKNKEWLIEKMSEGATVVQEEIFIDGPLLLPSNSGSLVRCGIETNQDAEEVYFTLKNAGTHITACHFERIL